MLCMTTSMESPRTGGVYSCRILGLPEGGRQLRAAVTIAVCPAPGKTVRIGQRPRERVGRFSVIPHLRQAAVIIGQRGLDHKPWLRLRFRWETGPLAALDPSTGVDAAPSPSLQLQAHLFRAASLFALYVRSGESRQELRTQALAEIDLGKRIDATFQPSTQVFAPRFIMLYKTGGAAASHTANATQ